MSLAAKQQKLICIDGNEKFQFKSLPVFLVSCVLVFPLSPFFPHLFSHFSFYPLCQIVYKEAVFVNKTSIFVTKSRRKTVEEKKEKKQDESEIRVRKAEWCEN